MRSLILSILFIAIGMTSIAQGVELCSDAEMAPVALAPAPSTTTTITIDPSWTVDGSYAPASIGTPTAVAYFSFTVDATGYYNLDFESAIISDVSVGLSDNSLGTACPMDATMTEIFSGMLMSGMPTNVSCTYFTTGTIYTIALAVEAVNAGTVDFTIIDATGASNEDCAGATPMGGLAILGDNSCSDGLVWYSYTVVNGGTVTVSTSPTGTGISTPVITNTYLNGCVTPDGNTMWTCLPVGTIINIEVGDDTAPIEQGDFNLTVTDDPTGVPNETCADLLTPQSTVSCLTTVLSSTDNTTANACPEALDFGNCGVFNTEATVWYSFDTDANAESILVNLSNGFSYVLIDGTAGCPSTTTTVSGCVDGDGTDMSYVVSPNTTYYIAVSTSSGGTDGVFNLEVTPIDAPMNDLCANATDISATAAVGVDGTTACASSDMNDFCTTISEDHVVYYSYTVDAAITTNRTLTITTTTNTNTSGTVATSLGYGLFDDCVGTASMLTPTTGDLCDPLTGDITIECVEPGTTIIIAVASEDMGEGDFNIMITEMATGSATNDDCDLATNPDITSVATGTNFCADGELNFCGMTLTTDHQVWYQYTNNDPSGNNVDLEITFSGTGTATSATDLSMVVLTGACGDNTFYPGTDGTTYCNILDNVVTISCIEQGETIKILVGSIEDPNVMGPEGDFNISTSVIPNGVANDECDMPEDITSQIMTCTDILINTDNTNACSEEFNVAGGCNFATDPTVWYSFTVPAGPGPYSLEISGIDAGSYMAIFNDGIDCDNPGGVAINSPCMSGAGPFDSFDPLTPGATYLIAFANPTEGAHNFTIRVNELPANDECADAETLNPGVAVPGTTTCATQETPSYNSGVCADTDETNTVWYEYTVPATSSGFQLTVTASGASPFMGNLNAVVFETSSPGCVTDGSTFADEVCTTSGTLVQDFECIGPGTYIIRISTSETNAGDFDILINDYTSPVVNDLCSSPTLIDQDFICEWVPVTANTENACPEQFDFASDCGFDDFPVVWYEINITDPNATEIQLDMNSSASGSPFYSVFAGGAVDCSNLVPSSISGICESGLGMNGTTIDISGNPPQTYLIGIGADIASGSSSIQFEIKVLVPPANDDPCNAEIISTAGDVNTTVSGTTQCASFDIDEASCGDQDENSVWYEYTLPAGTTGFIATISNVTGQDYLLAVTGDNPCGAGNITLLDPTVPADCDAEDGDEMKFTCLDEGITVYIMVSTETVDEGSFDLTIDPIVPDPLCVDNDLCTDADNSSPIATPVTDGGQVCVSDCNLDACPENFFAAGCAYNDFPTVFYTVTTDANATDATMTTILTSMDGNPIFSIFEFDCNNPTAVTPASLCVEGDGANASLSNMEVDANTTYIIAVALDQPTNSIEGGDFELCVNVTTSCNDDPCSPYPLVAGDGVGSPALDCDNNIGATDEPFDYGGCGSGTAYESTVYFSYTVPDNVYSFTVLYTNDGAMGIQNEVVLTVLEYDAANCDSPQLVAGQECGDPNVLEPVEIQCPPAGNTYLIQVTSAAADQGEFDIQISETLQTNACASNDACDNAMVLDVSATCMWLDFADCNIQACPEEFVDPGMACNFDGGPVTWYSFTTPASASSASIEVVPGSVTDPTWGLFLDEGCPEVPTAVNGDVICVTTGGNPTAIFEGIPIEENTTYYIAVGSESGIEGDFTINLLLEVPPINDDPCINADNPPIDLSGGGSHSGTTCCARGSKDANADGSPADWPNVDCNESTEDAAVWYMFTPNPDDDGYNIILEAGDVEGPLAIEVYAGAPDQGCSGFGETLASSCSPTSANFQISNCFEPGEVVFIKVTTDDDDDNCGTFTITVSPASCGEMNDECFESLDEDPIMPVTNPEFQIDYTCVTGCLQYACPEDDAFGGCPDMTQMPTVWYHVTTDDIAAQMFTTVTANGNWEPIWSIYSGTSCDDLAVVNFGGVPPCSNGDSTPELHQVGVSENSDYWIGITVDPGSLPPSGIIDDGSFELCVATTITAIICLGEEVGDCDDESLVMEITDRENDLPLDPDGDGIAGPFCAGEEVNINIEFFYDASDSGADWLIGFVPIFGPGWDLEGFDYAANAPNGNGNTAQWYEDTGDCAPIIQEPNPIICTFVNADGNLQICNQLCSPCSDCPESGMEMGDPLPSGYFWVSNGGNAGCENDCSPGEGWGIGSVTSQITWSFTLRVKEFESYEECLENNDLSISFQTFSDGVGGCWEDPVGECILDRAMFSAPWKVECNAPPAVEGEDMEICHDGITDIDVSTVDGSPNTVIVEVEDNPFVDGENPHTFPGGGGTIMDDLFNNSNSIQEVIYTVYSEDPNLPCPGPVNEIIVTIYPELIVEFEPVYVCEGDCTDLIPTVEGGIGNPYTYSWSTGEVTPTINVCPVVPTTYFVTVTDDLGCQNVGEVEVDVKPPVELSLPESIDVCKDGSFDPFQPDYIVTLEFLSGSPIYNVVWTPDPGLVGQPTTVNGNPNDSWIINEESSSDILSPLQLCADVTDMFGCMNSICMEVNVTGQITLVPEVIGLECGDTEAEIRVTGLDNLGNPITTFQLWGGCPEDDFLDEGFSNSGVVTFPPVSLLDYNCFTIIAETDAGCTASVEIDIPLTEGTPIEISGDNAVCEGETATITIDNASDYNSFVWTPTSLGSGSSVSFVPDSTTTIFVEATDLTGCTSQEIFTVVLNTPPTVGISGTTTFCEGSSASVTASGGTSYEWTGGVMGATYTSSTDGETVTVTVTDVNGCTADSTITFTQEDVITINLGDVNICDGMGDTVFVNGNFINFNWQDAGGMTVSDTSFYVITGAGDFTVTAIDAASGCDAMGSFTVMDFATPQITVTDMVEVCRQDSGVDSLCVNFTNQVSGATGTWTQVDNIPGFVFSDWPKTNVCFEGIQVGCYDFVFTTNSAQAPCMNVSDTMTVCVKSCPCPDPSTTSIDPICNNGTEDLSDAELTTDPGTWTVESGPAEQDLTGIITASPIFDATGIMAGDYVVRFTLDNPGGPACDVFTEQTITVFAAPNVMVLGEGNICNIPGQDFPQTIDLFDLISVDASDGGTWEQTTGTMVTITGGSTVDANDLSTFPESLTFTYTSGVEAGSPCPPDMVTVTVNALDCNCPFIDVEPDTLCNNGVAIDLNDLLTNPEGLAGTWSVAPNQGLTGSSFNPNGLPSGAYVITFTLDNDPGDDCPTEFSNTILVRRQPVANPIQGAPPCSMDTGNGPTTSNLYDWLASGYSAGTWAQTGGTPTLTFTDNGINMAVVDFVGQPVGSMFEFTYTTTNANAPCTNIETVITITVSDCNCPPIMLSTPDPVCNDAGMIDLCALTAGSDPGTYTVETAGGTDVSDRINGCMFDATGLNAGTYTLIFTLDEVVTGICEQSLTVMFDVENYQTVDLVMNPGTLCSDPNGNGETTLNFNSLVSNASAGTWTDEDGSGVNLDPAGLTSVSFAGVPAGDYTFNYTIDNDDPCEDFILTVDVTVVEDCNCPPINLGLIPDICSTDGPVDLTQYGDANNAGTWSSTELTINNGNSLVIDGVAAGTYVLTYTLDAPLPDCPETETAEILIGEPANAGIANDYALCEGEAEVISLADLLDGADTGGSWSETSGTLSGGFDDVANTVNTDGVAAGSYTFEYSITNNDPCPDASVVVTLRVDPLPVADAGGDKFLDCDNPSSTIGGNGTSTGAEYSYSWVNTTTGNEVGTTATLSISNEGIFELTVTNTATGCISTDQVEVMKADDLPQMDINPRDITCAGDDDGGVDISNQQGGDGNYMYTLNGGTPTANALDFANLPAGDYTIAIIDGNGCSNVYDFTINEPELLVVDAGPEIIFGELGEEFILSIEPFDTTGITSITWSNQEDTTQVFCSGLDCMTINVQPDQNTTYYVEVVNENGCKATDEVQIQLTQIVDVTFPNIISPNEDGINDFFYVNSNDVRSIVSLKIFDRWGEKVYEAANFEPNDPTVGWDGKFRDRTVVSGVYVFIIDVEFVNDTRKTFSGDVTVIDIE